MSFYTRPFRRGMAASVLTAVSLFLATQADAFGGGSRLTDSGTIGDCTFSYDFLPSSFQASVTLTSISGGRFYPDNRVYQYSSNTINGNNSGVAPSNSRGRITISAIEACGFTDVENVGQSGADNTFATDSYMGFAFRAIRDGVRSDYEIALQGASDTQFVETNINVPPPPVTISADAGADVTAAAGETISLAGSIGGAPTGTVTQNWTVKGGTFGNGTSLTPTFTVPAGASVGTVYTLVLTLTETIDGFPPREVLDTMTVTVALPPLVITADAGADVTGLAGANVALTGQIMNSLSMGVTQNWTATGGTITNATTLTPVFAIPAGAAVGTVYTLTLTLSQPGTPPATDTMTITVVAGAGPSAAQTEAAITSFAQTRMNSLIELQPDLLSLGGGANVVVSTRGGTVDVATAPGQNAWARLKGNWSTLSGAKNDYILGAAGTHMQVSDNLRLGLMLQFDHMASVNGAETLSANGFMAGPYVVATLPDKSITFDGRVLFGKASNSYAPLGTFTDHFDSQRMLAQFGMTGEITQAHVTWAPSLRASLAQEKTAAYLDGVGTNVAATDTRLSQIAGGIEARFALPAPTGKLTATLGLFDVWTGGTSALQGHRGKITAGLRRDYAAGQTLSLTASYDGLGSANYKSTSLDLLFQHRF